MVLSKSSQGLERLTSFRVKSAFRGRNAHSTIMDNRRHAFNYRMVHARQEIYIEHLWETKVAL